MSFERRTARKPAKFGQAHGAAGVEGDALFFEQAALFELAPLVRDVSATCIFSTQYALPRYPRTHRRHGTSGGARGARHARRYGQIAVGHDATARNALHHASEALQSIGRLARHAQAFRRYVASMNGFQV
jgi:hypothetical protein